MPFVMGLSSLIIAWITFLKFSKNKNNKIEMKHEMEVCSPFEILPALKFGIVFVVVLFAITFGKKYLGDMGVYGASLLSGLVDIDAVVLSSIEAVRQGELSIHTAETAVLIGLIMNSLIKIAYVAVLGTKKLVKKISLGVIAVSLIGFIVFATLV
jgi:uncharacterized membrane protein (DUF4010 family)